MRRSRRSPAHPCFAIARNGRCSCLCGCSVILHKEEISEVGDICDACFRSLFGRHQPTRGGDTGPFRISFDTDPTPAFGIVRPTLEGDNQ
jgi:hypothetical protein